jgi:hypothetical protein
VSEPAGPKPPNQVFLAILAIFVLGVIVGFALGRAL